ncbi:MAG: chemotaxis protein CheV [Helicobacteraceae bacterium]|jgi:two-component system chemotaxis response regulator CheV|nr:chemotaxis protein CheV [Helicobacteraceae bacterium]
MSDTIKKMEETSKTHLHNIMQIAVFQLNDKNFYGINISKIRSIEDYKKYEVFKNNTVDNRLLEGYIRYQNTIVPVIALERWLDIWTPENLYYEYLICDFNRARVAFPIRGIRNIFNVPIGNLQKPQRTAGTLIYETIVEIEGEKTIVLVLDVEKLLFDTFGANYDLKDAAHEAVSSEKKLLIAEDSKTAQEIVRDIMRESGIDFAIFDDGQELTDYLDALDDDGVDEIGLVITDLEMPRKDGYQVLKHIREKQRYSNIPVAINTSMSDPGVNEKVTSMGASGFIVKTDPKTFMSTISALMRK